MEQQVEWAKEDWVSLVEKSFLSGGFKSNLRKLIEDRFQRLHK